MKEQIFVKWLKGELSFTLIFPIKVATELDIDKSDFLQCSIEDSRLIITKLDQKGISDE